jgi:putative phosphoribosyl transferase
MRVPKPLFTNRAEGGDRLGQLLREREWTDPVVLGMARGGLPVAAKVADALGAPLDVAVARKIGAPGQPEFGLGAVTADGPPYYDRHSLLALGLTEAALRPIRERERAEARRRLAQYRQIAAAVPLAGREVILVDDGLATGVTARAALRQLRAAGPRRLVFATPVGARESAAALRADAEADEVACLYTPEKFRAVGLWYDDFAQVSDEEVLATLAGAKGATN